MTDYYPNISEIESSIVRGGDGRESMVKHVATLVFERDDYMWRVNPRIIFEPSNVSPERFEVIDSIVECVSDGVYVVSGFLSYDTYAPVLPPEKTVKLDDVLGDGGVEVEAVNVSMQYGYSNKDDLANHVEAGLMVTLGEGIPENMFNGE